MAKKPKPQDAPAEQSAAQPMSPDWEMLAGEHLAKLQRATADLDNLNKKMAAEKDAWASAGRDHVLHDLLGVVDNFDRALEHVPADQATSGWLTGITYIHKQLLDILKNYGVEKKAIAIGDPFDHHSMHGVEKKISADVPEDHVLAVISSPYEQRGQLFRPGSVIVSAGASEEGASQINKN